MPFIGALLGAIMTGLMWWLLFGNGKEAIDYWLDQRNARKNDATSTTEANTGRENERRAALRTLQDPREAAIAVMVAVAEARGDLTAEQTHEIRAQMRTVLGYADRLDDHIVLARHASRTAGKAEAVIDETVGLFLSCLTVAERGDLIGMVEAVAALHGGGTDAQLGLIARLKRRLGLPAA